MIVLWRVISQSLYMNDDGPYWHENSREYLVTFTRQEEDDLREYQAEQTDGEYQVRVDRLGEIPMEDLPGLMAALVRAQQKAEGVVV
jgi:hypothetical protein